MTRNWAQLGAELKAARTRKGMEQQDVAARLEKSRGAIANIENGKIKSLSPTVHAYASLVGWGEGAIERVLDGGEPGGASAHGGASDVLPDLPLHVAQALQEGRLIDSWVETVETPSGEIQISTVARIPDGATPEQVRDALGAWRERRRKRSQGQVPPENDEL